MAPTAPSAAPAMPSFAPGARMRMAADSAPSFEISKYFFTSETVNSGSSTTLQIEIADSRTAER